jgi:hypothetical protein
MIEEPPKGAVDWMALYKIQDEAEALRRRNMLDGEAFLGLWRRAKLACPTYPAALQSLKMMAPPSVIRSL